MASLINSDPADDSGMIPSGEGRSGDSISRSEGRSGDSISRSEGRSGDLAAVRFNSDGLVPAIVQEAATGAVLMLAWMNAEALERTLSTGRTWFWSRSRSEYWCKGETSGDRQWVKEAYYDCDGDTLLFVVDQEGRGACHTGKRTCFFRSFGGGDSGVLGGSARTTLDGDR